MNMSVLAEIASAVATVNFPGAEAPPGADKIMTVVAWIGWGAAIAGFVGFLIVGIRMMLSHNRGEGTSETGKRLAMVFGGLILVGAAAGLVGTFL